MRRLRFLPCCDLDVGGPGVTRSSQARRGRRAFRLEKSADETFFVLFRAKMNRERMACPAFQPLRDDRDFAALRGGADFFCRKSENPRFPFSLRLFTPFAKVLQQGLPPGAQIRGMTLRCGCSCDVPPHASGNPTAVPVVGLRSAGRVLWDMSCCAGHRTFGTFPPSRFRGTT